MQTTPDPTLPPLGGLTDEELALRTRAIAVLIEAARHPDGGDDLSGYRDLIREMIEAARQQHGAKAALGLIVEELVIALDDPAHIDLLIEFLQAKRAAR